MRSFLVLVVASAASANFACVKYPITGRHNSTIPASSKTLPPGHTYSSTPPPSHSYTTFLPPGTSYASPALSNYSSIKTLPPTSPAETCTGSTSLSDCPDSTKCYGQTLTWTSTEGPLACAPSITCTCAFPTAPPVLNVCPNNVTCTGQTTTWTSATLGPSSCGSICTVVLPSTGKIGPKPTAASRVGPVLSNDAERESAAFGVVIAVAIGGALLI